MNLQFFELLLIALFKQILMTHLQWYFYQPTLNPLTTLQSPHCLLSSQDSDVGGAGEGC